MHRFRRGGDFKWLRHAAQPRLAALGHFARVRADDVHAVGDELREIALRRLCRPHPRVHGRRNENRLVGREQHGGGEIVGMAARHFRHEIGGRRRDHDEIGVARQANMTDVELALRIEQIGIGALAAQRAGGKRRDEALRGGGENAAHLGAAILQAPDQVERFVGGDAAADDEENLLPVRRSRARLSWRWLRWLEAIETIVFRSLPPPA